MLKPRECDVAVIGAGTAGLAAYRSAKAAGAKVLLIEAGEGGTTCTRFGCMPSKLLLAAGRAAREARHAAAFGVKVGAVSVDSAAVMRRVRRLRDHFVQDVLDEMADLPASDRLKGRARFAGRDRLVVDDNSLVRFRAAVIATGARPVVPADLAEACGERVLTHETVFDLKSLPASLAVIGAGPLGLELAIAFARLGVKTTVFDAGRDVGGARDPVIAAAARETLAAELSFEFEAEVSARRKPDGGLLLSWTDGAGKGRRKSVDYVLDAAGRKPAVAGLDLNLAGLTTDEHDVPLFDPATLRCGQSNVFIAGDANADRPVLHEAAWQGELAGTNAARAPKLERRKPVPDMAIVYTDPDIARVGEAFDPERAKSWVIGCSNDVGRATLEDRPAGVLRVYADAGSGVVQGGELFGTGVEHLAHLLAWATTQGLSVADVVDLPFYHPTLEEGLRSALRDAAAQLA